MEILMYAVLALAAAIIVQELFARRQRKRLREAHDAEIKAASEAAAKKPHTPAMRASDGPFVHVGTIPRGVRYTRSAMASAPTTVVRDDNTGNMLMAGAIGYMLANSGNSHAGESRSHSESTPDLSCRPSEGSFGGAGASSSYESSSSSDSSSSYDSGSSSSDSGSSSSSSSD